MYLRLLELEEFRNYRRLDIPLAAAGLRLVGRNASGKSSFLEAIAMLATTRSARATIDAETIRWASGTDLGVVPYARLRGVVQRRDGDVEIEIGLQADPRRSSIQKSIRLNGRAVRAIDAVGQLKAVLFGPEDVGLMTGSPSHRRRYLDLTISQINPSYLRSLSRFGRVLAQRNSLLKALQRERIAPRSPKASEQLAFWDEELLLHGGHLIADRIRSVRRLASLAAPRYAGLTGATLTLRYLPSLDLSTVETPDDVDLDELQALVRRAYVQALMKRREDEVRRGLSLVGPHRDDLRFFVDTVDLGIYGSRGQQRLAVIALKLAETVLMSEAAGEAPVLLLDDVLSELDRPHRQQFETAASEVAAQVFVTGTESADWSGSTLANLPGFQVVGGIVTPCE